MLRRHGFQRGKPIKRFEPLFAPMTARRNGPRCRDCKCSLAFHLKVFFGKRSSREFGPRKVKYMEPGKWQLMEKSLSFMADYQSPNLSLFFSLSSLSLLSFSFSLFFLSPLMLLFGSWLLTQFDRWLTPFTFQASKRLAAAISRVPYSGWSEGIGSNHGYL